jgi:hypothetical protein
MPAFDGITPGVPGVRSLLSAVALNTPATLTSALYVKVPSLGDQRWGPCTFMPRDAALPVAGSQCLIAIDENDRAWVVCWV